MSRVFTAGGPVSGDQFICRAEQVAQIAEVILHDNKSVSMVGLPGVGKTFVGHAVLERIKSKGTDDDRHVLVAEISLINTRRFEDCLCAIVRMLFKEADANAISNDSLRELKNKLMPEAVPTNNLYGYVINRAEIFLRRLSKLDVRSIVFIDDFDEAVKLFVDANGAPQHSYYDWFRNIINNYERYGVQFLFASCRPVKKLEPDPGGNSPLFMLCTDESIREFSDYEMQEFFKILANNSRELTEDEENAITHIAGRFPILLNLIGERVVDMYREIGDIDVTAILNNERNRKRLHDIYEDIFMHLQNHPKDDMLETVYKAVIGPRYDIKPDDINMLKEMGYLSDSLFTDADNHESDKGWTIISPDFMMYLHVNKLRVSIWPSLEKACHAIKEIIQTVMTSVYSCSVTELDDKLLEKKDIALNPSALGHYEKHVKTNKDKYPNADDCTLFDVVPLCFYVNIMKKNWEYFRDYFDNTPFQKWENDFNLLCDARNPAAHFTQRFLSEQQIEGVNIICERIIKCLGADDKHKQTALGLVKL